MQYLEKSIKLHLYWAMKNCGGDADKLCKLVENIPQHYQVSIDLCSAMSNANYVNV